MKTFTANGLSKHFEGIFEPFVNYETISFMALMSLLRVLLDLVA